MRKTKTNSCLSKNVQALNNRLLLLWGSSHFMLVIGFLIILTFLNSREQRELLFLCLIAISSISLIFLGELLTKSKGGKIKYKGSFNEMVLKLNYCGFSLINQTFNYYLFESRLSIIGSKKITVFATNKGFILLGEWKVIELLNRDLENIYIDIGDFSNVTGFCQGFQCKGLYIKTYR